MSTLAITRPRWRSISLPAVPADLLGLYVALLGAAISVRPAMDHDLGWHLRNGQMILATHSVSQVDLFSYTRAGAPLNNFEWLWDVSVAAMFGVGGTLPLIIVNAGVVGTILGCVYVMLRVRGLTPALGAIGAALAMANLVPYEEVRPGMTGALMVALFLLFLELDHRDSNWRWLMPLAGLQLLWANCHGSFMLGPALCGLYVAAALWERKRISACRLAGASLGLAITSLANPAGFRLLRFALTASRLPFNREFVHEWMPPNFNSGLFLPLLCSIVLSVALASLLRTRRLEAHRVVLLVGCTLAALQSAQFIPVYAVAAAPVIGELLHGALHRPIHVRLTAAHAAFAAYAVALVAVAALRTTLSPERYQGLLASKFPVAAVDFVQEEHLKGPMWNDFDWGSYLISALPRMPVLVDGRAELYGQNFLQQYLDVASGRQMPDQAFERYGVRLALIPVRSPLATELRQRPVWREAFHDSVASVFVLQADMAGST